MGDDLLVLVTFRGEHSHLHEELRLMEMLAEAGVRVERWSWDDDSKDWSRPSMALVRSTWDYFDRLNEFVAWVDGVSSLTRVLNPPTVLKWNVHKAYLQELHREGIAVVPTRTIAKDSGETVADVVRDTGWSDGVVKPAVSGGSKDTVRFEGGALADAEALVRRVGMEKDMMVQPFVRSIVDEGERSLLFFGNTFSHAARKVPKAGDFRSQGHFQSDIRSVVPSEREMAVANAALGFVQRRFGVDLAYGRVDLVSVEGAPAIMELELIEPYLYLDYGDGAYDRLVAHVRGLMTPNSA